jgi:hypothetical protein
MTWVDLIIRTFHEIAWPGAAIWIGWYFRDAILEQLPRVTKVGPVTLNPPAQANARLPKASNEVTNRSSIPYLGIC